MQRPYFQFNPNTHDALRLIGASADLLDALDGLTQCFDSEGIFHVPDDICALWDNARAAIELAVAPDAYRAWVAERTK